MKTISSALILILLSFLSVEVGAQDVTIELTVPADGTTVKQREYVRGHVSDSNAIVVVVVHPTETSDFWIQPPVTVKKSGAWKVKAHFGRPGKDRGAEYEVRAFVNPNKKLGKGMMVANWPSAQAQSDVVDVTRN